MKSRILNTLFMTLIVIMVIVFAAIVLINFFDKEESEVGGLKDITGATQSYEVYHGTAKPQYIHIRTSERYDDKYFEHLEHIQEQRDKTFMKGKVFLREK